MEDKLLTKQQVMEYLNISRKMFEKLVKEHGLPVIKITPYKRYVRSSHLNQYIDNRTKNKPQGTSSEPQEKDSDNIKWKNIFK